VETIADAQQAGKRLLELGSQMAIITMGEQGAVICTKQGQCEHVALDQTVTVCDSTGAGDSFVGTLALLMAQKTGMSLPEQVKRACRVASQSVEKKGTQTSYPNKNELRFSLFD
jgi:ribokinase